MTQRQEQLCWPLAVKCHEYYKPWTAGKMSVRVCSTSWRVVRRDILQLPRCEEYMEFWHVFGRDREEGWYVSRLEGQVFLTSDGAPLHIQLWRRLSMGSGSADQPAVGGGR